MHEKLGWDLRAVEPIERLGRVEFQRRIVVGCVVCVCADERAVKRVEEHRGKRNNDVRLGTRRCAQG